jgi:hypothetical protein
MVFSSTPSLNTLSPRCTRLIDPLTAGDTSVEAAAVTTLPSGGTFLVEGEDRVMAGCGGDEREGEGEK